MHSAGMRSVEFLMPYLRLPLESESVTIRTWMSMAASTPCLWTSQFIPLRKLPGATPFVSFPRLRHLLTITVFTIVGYPDTCYCDHSMTPERSPAVNDCYLKTSRRRGRSGTDVAV